MKRPNELHVIRSRGDGHKIDEVKTLTYAVDMLSHHMAALCDDDEGFNVEWHSFMAQTVSDLCEMARQREEEREERKGSETKGARP